MIDEKIYLGVPFTGVLHESLIPFTREDESIAFAVGIKLCGIDNVEVFMQNSGFGTCLDVITSLLIPYDIQLSFDIHEGSNTPQHAFMNNTFDIIKGLVL